ncbi:hypothetical protein HOLleu_18966 [Holothuria leucospilota]|uniref:Transmembrane protein 220 n=1 Tax=Holothuria leucospilota TaxID=206669 RepID=A0A9Q1C401_HOLLE|nr:hypothetical protein HOLleu_18966 [Holothuria leucospilota]
MQFTQSRDAETNLSSNMIFWRLSNGVMSGFFLLATFVQRNDPDSLLWMTLYIIPAIFCIIYSLKLCNPGHNILYRSVQLHVAFCLVIALYTIFKLLQINSTGTEPILSWHELEETRELGGLCFIISWLVLNLKFFSSNTARQRQLSRVLATLSVLPILLWMVSYLNKDYQAKLPQHCKTSFQSSVQEMPSLAS